MDYLTLGLLNGLIVPLILGSPDKSGFLVVPKSNEGFSTFANVESTKLNPNGATVRQWETRTWITTIPLHKIVNLKSSPLESITHLPVTKISKSSKSPLVISTDNHYLPLIPETVDPFLIKPFYQHINLTRSKKDDESGEGDGHGSKRVIHVTSYYPPFGYNDSCYGDSCRRKPHQGISYEKETLTPEIKTLPRYTDEPSYSKTSPYRHSDDKSDSGDYHDAYGEHDDKSSRSKANIAWTRIHPTEIHFKADSFIRTGYYPVMKEEDSDSNKELNGRSKSYPSEFELSISTKKPSTISTTTMRPYFLSELTDSYESHEESSNRAMGKSKLSRSRYRLKDDHPALVYSQPPTSSKFHREKDNPSGKKVHYHYRSTDYPSDDHVDRSSEDQLEKSFSKDKYNKKTYLRAHQYQPDHTHSGEETHELTGGEERGEGSGGRRGNYQSHHHAGYDKDDKGYFFEPTNLSGHFTSTEVTKSFRNARPFKSDPIKLNRKSSCHCLKSDRKAKNSDYSDSSREDKRKAR